MDKDEKKRVMDGPITTSMRSEGPTPESIQGLRERYALFDKMTAKKPAESFDSVLAGAGRQDNGEAASSHTMADDALPSSTATSQNTAESSDTFERTPTSHATSAVRPKGPLPSGRHPDTPGGGRGKVFIKA